MKNKTIRTIMQMLYGKGENNDWNMEYDCDYCGKSKISNRMLTSFKPKTLTNLAFSIEGKKIYIKEKGYGRKFGFYLEGNTYKYDTGKGKCVAVCTIDRKIIRPELPVRTNRIKEIFKKPDRKLSWIWIIHELDKAGLVEKF